MPAKELPGSTANGKGHLTALPAALQATRQPEPCAKPADASPSLEAAWAPGESIMVRHIFP